MCVILANLHPYSLWDMMTAHTIRLDSPFPTRARPPGMS